RGGRDGDLHRLVPLLLADHGHGPSIRLRARRVQRRGAAGRAPARRALPLRARPAGDGGGLRGGDGLRAPPARAMTSAWGSRERSVAERAAFADAEPRPFWLEPAREVSPALRESVDADLCIVGGGFTGLWAALQAKADDPAREVVLLEAETCGFGASG